jgi:hypothetical protein
MAKIDDWGSHIGHITKTAIPRVKDDVKKALFEAYNTKISSIPDLEACVRVLENCPPVNHPPPNRPTPIDTSCVNNVPPAQRNPLPDNNAPILAEPSPADPRVQFDKDPAISINERTRNTWANSPSGRAAGSQHETPSQPANNPYNQPPLWYTPPRPPNIGANESQGTEPTPGGPIVSPRQGDQEGQARKLGTSRFDIVKLASTDYHIGTFGVAVLMHAILVKCGYSNIASSELSRATTTSLQYTAKYVSFGTTRLRILAACRSTI